MKVFTKRYGRVIDRDDVVIKKVTADRVAGCVTYPYKPYARHFDVKLHPGNKFFVGTGSGKAVYYLNRSDTPEANIAAAFKAAKELLAHNKAENRFNPGGTKEEFICNALEKLDTAKYPGAAAAIGYVHDCFGGTIYGWLYDNVTGAIPYINNDDHLQAYKHRWLDYVIQQFGG